MTKAQIKKLLLTNLALWIVALLAHPVVRLLPTASGQPAKIFEFLIPVFMILLAGVSTYLLKAASGKPTDD